MGDPLDKEEYRLIVKYMTGFLCLLQILHIYWFALLTRVGLRILNDGSEQVRIGIERPVPEELKQD